MFHNKNICRLLKVYHPNFTGYHSKKILCFYSSFPLYYFLQGQKCVNKKEGPSFFLKGITFLCRLLNSKPESCNKEHAFFTCQVGDSMAEDDFLSKNRYKF